MSQNPHRLDYAAPDESKRPFGPLIIGILVLIGVGLVMALFARVQVPPPMPTVVPPAPVPATQGAAPSPGGP